MALHGHLFLLITKVRRTKEVELIDTRKSIVLFKGTVYEAYIKQTIRKNTKINRDIFNSYLIHAIVTNNEKDVIKGLIPYIRS